jgi:hypothetical protein
MSATEAVGDVKPAASPASGGWPQQLLLFALIFAALMLLHAPLLRLPYFWDEAGYYIPAVHDLYASATVIPQSTISNAHPPLVMAWLALAWRVAGFSPLVTRTAMLAVAAFALLGLFRLAHSAANVEVATATTMMVALYPVFFSQSSLAHLDLAAAGFTFWGLLAWVEDRPVGQVAWFSLAALTKETAILAPLALFAWDIVARETRQAASIRERFAELAPMLERKRSPAMLLFPLLPLACWYGFHYAKTGYLLGNPEFYRYNVAATIDAGRIPIALGIRFWQMFGYFGLWLLTVAGILAMTRKPQIPAQAKLGRGTLQVAVRPRIPIWIQGAFFSVALAYLLFMAVIGGAVLARYVLPVVPLIMMVLISTLWRRVRYWTLIAAAIAVVFVTGLFHNPPYGFSLEDNLAYRDFVVLHAQAIRLLQMRYPHARVLTAWPASDELNRPWLGYVSQPFSVVRIEDFREAEIARAVDARSQFDVALVFSTKYEPEHPLFANWRWWQQVKERYFGYHRDLKPEGIAGRLNGRLLFRKEMHGQWVGIIDLENASE